MRRLALWHSHAVKHSLWLHEYLVGLTGLLVADKSALWLRDISLFSLWESAIFIDILEDCLDKLGLVV